MKDYLIAGRHPVLEALIAGKKVEKVLFQKGASGVAIDEIRRILITRKIPYQFVPPPAINKIYRKNHQGVVAFLSVVDYYELEDVIAQIYGQGEDPLILILDGITDVRNFGAIARTAWGMGVHAICVPTKGGAAINTDAMKTSAGALNHIRICKVNRWEDAAELLKANGISVYVLDGNAPDPIRNAEKTKPIALVLGSEDQGPSKVWEEAADASFNLPILSGLESYNVSVAAAMALYELRRD